METSAKAAGRELERVMQFDYRLVAAVAKAIETVQLAWEDHSWASDHLLKGIVEGRIAEPEVDTSRESETECTADLERNLPMP